MAIFITGGVAYQLFVSSTVLFWCANLALSRMHFPRGGLVSPSQWPLKFNLKFNLKTYGGRSFTIAEPSVWNALPFVLRSCNSLSSFKSKLKTWLFKIGYDVVV